MKPLLAFACVVASACATSSDHLPVQGDNGGEPPISAGAGGTGAASLVIAGRVCLLIDPRIVSACSPVGGGGLTITVGGLTTQTADNGSFSVSMPAPITVPTGPTATLTVTGTDIVPSTTLVATSATTAMLVPVMPAGLFQQVLDDENVVVPSNEGTVIATVEDATGLPVAGVAEFSAPPSAFGPFYATSNPMAFSTTATEQLGMSLFPGIPTGTADLTFDNAGFTAETTVNGVQVIANGVTFANATLPTTP
jgi:hypothetical protein